MCQFDMQSRANAFKKFEEKRNLNLGNKYLTPLRNMEFYENCKEKYTLKNLDYFEYMQYLDSSEHYLGLFLDKSSTTSLSNISNVILGNYSLMLRSVQCNMENNRSKDERINKLAVADFSLKFLLNNVNQIYNDFQTEK